MWSSEISFAKLIRGRERTVPTALSLLCWCAVVLSGCPDDSPPGADGAAGSPCSSNGAQRCNGDTRERCVDGRWQAVETCTSPSFCDAKLASCVSCQPGGTVCKGDDLHRCGADGQIGDKIRSCPDGTCKKDRCTDPCSLAEASHSYMGCEYWPTVTSNSGLPDNFTFAVAVANPQAQTARVVIATKEFNASPIKQVDVGPHSVVTVELPWVDELKNTPGNVYPRPPERSALVKEGAYRLTSSLPVAVYQFNPLEYVVPGPCWFGNTRHRYPDKQCHSSTNDASLLLPAHALGKEYMVLSRATWMASNVASYQSPGFFAVVATSAGDTKVTVKFSANTEAGAGGLRAYKAGETGTFTLPQWSVLQIVSELPATCTAVVTSPGGTGYCDLSKTTDLTGTEIAADKQVAVFSGHDCTFVPFHKGMCDHLEEQLFPTTTWGSRYVGAHTRSSGTDPSLYLVVSAEDDNAISFSGAVHSALTLDRGEHVELLTDKDFEVSGSGRLALVQLMVGQSYSKTSSSDTSFPGDPSMALAVPVEQYRTSYLFHAPKSYLQNYLNVIARSGSKVTLDGKEVTGFAAIPSSKYMVARLEVTPGAHAVSGVLPFGIAAYGVGSATSYMYPGGLDLAPLVLE